MPYCKNCGQELDENDLFCNQCGKKSEKTEAYVEDEKAVTDNNAFQIVPLIANAVAKAIICFAIAAICIPVSYAIGGFCTRIIAYLLTFYGGTLLVKKNKKAYLVKCPKCGIEFKFGIDNLNETCPKCKKTLIIKENQIVCTDNI